MDFWLKYVILLVSTLKQFVNLLNFSLITATLWYSPQFPPGRVQCVSEFQRGNEHPNFPWESFVCSSNGTFSFFRRLKLKAWIILASNHTRCRRCERWYVQSKSVQDRFISYATTAGILCCCLFWNTFNWLFCVHKTWCHPRTAVTRSRATFFKHSSAWFAFDRISWTVLAACPSSFKIDWQLPSLLSSNHSDQRQTFILGKKDLNTSLFLQQDTPH